MNKQQISVAIGALIIGIIIGVGSFIVFEKDRVAKENGPSVSDTWPVFTSEKFSYSIKFPDSFVQEGERVIRNFDVKEYDKASTTQVLIQINKVAFTPVVSKATFSEDVKRYYPNAKAVPNLEPAHLGEYISQMHYIEDLGQGIGATIFYSNLDISDTDFYSIVVYEPGYSHNKTLVENMLKTFVPVTASSSEASSTE